MVSSAAWSILRIVGWMILPDYMARAAFQLYHRIRLRLLPAFNRQASPPPNPGTPTYVYQQRLSFAIVILTYLAWTTGQAYFTTPPSLYQILKVPSNADEARMKAAFRAFARYNHPDKVGQRGEALFIVVRDAFDSLKHPVKRFAYDRFGPDALTWTQCQTPKDYVNHGVMAASGFYIGSILFMFLVGIFGRGGAGGYWRYSLFAVMGALELQMLVYDTPTIFKILFPSRLPFQHILFLHQLYISASIAITRVGPVLFPILGPSLDPVEQAKDVALWATPVAQKLVMLTQLAEKEISRMLAAELRAMHGVSPDDSASQRFDRAEVQAPFATPSKPGSTSLPIGISRNPTMTQLPSTNRWNEDIMRRLIREMEDMIVEKNIKGHPMLQSIWTDIVRREWEELNAVEREEYTAALSGDAANGSSVTVTELENSKLRHESLLPSPPTSISTLPRGETSPTPDIGSPPPDREVEPQIRPRV